MKKNKKNNKNKNKNKTAKNNDFALINSISKNKKRKTQNPSVRISKVSDPICNEIAANKNKFLKS